MTEIKKKENIKIIIQNLRYVIVHLKVFFILHQSFEINRLLSVMELDIVSMF